MTPLDGPYKLLLPTMRHGTYLALVAWIVSGCGTGNVVAAEKVSHLHPKLIQAVTRQLSDCTEQCAAIGEAVQICDTTNCLCTPPYAESLQLCAMCQSQGCNERQYDVWDKVIDLFNGICAAPPTSPIAFTTPTATTDPIPLITKPTSENDSTPVVVLDDDYILVGSCSRGLGQVVLPSRLPQPTTWDGDATSVPTPSRGLGRIELPAEEPQISIITVEEPYSNPALVTDASAVQDDKDVIQSPPTPAPAPTPHHTHSDEPSRTGGPNQLSLGPTGRPIAQPVAGNAGPSESSNSSALHTPSQAVVISTLFSLLGASVSVSLFQWHS
ncbi:hypothetical protein CC1G_05676 [Coprinopsis cinerea okayama7|uniref:Uncharacterized protein n=1 Tax=Coprinopsis cinerea (strain Okayama-7 / 130 / ATCC MYA-4618 / FGSC 9003) TaxID=240176 RepID=A8N9U9_COPC7|nr:hypothetical protein CC1G_05676 [Coprinopsis cinerea okayama7\|eukprot:XP_001831605.2 hypothetical protein CC1G_05676 [Coprinopsis cinerea okayama7\